MSIEKRQGQSLPCQGEARRAERGRWGSGCVPGTSPPDRRRRSPSPWQGRVKRRIFRILRQVVRDLEPRRLAGDEAVQLRPRRRIVEQRQRDAVLRRGVLRKVRRRLPVRPVAVDDRRAAFAAKPALIAARALIKLDQMLAPEPAKILRLHANAAAKRRAMLLAA